MIEKLVRGFCSNIFPFKTPSRRLSSGRLEEERERSGDIRSANVPALAGDIIGIDICDNECWEKGQEGES